MKLQRQQLANGDIAVWQDGEETIIHHTAGLTLALSEQEARQLWGWLGALHKQNEDIAALKTQVARDVPQRETLDYPSGDLLRYCISRLKDMYGIDTVICDDNSVIYEETQA